MPIYEYRRPDGTTFEVQQSFSDEPFTVDPETGVPVERVLHPPAVHFKGKGFYSTDYGSRKRQRETAAAAEGSAKSDASTGSGSSPGEGSSSKPGESSSGSGKAGKAAKAGKEGKESSSSSSSSSSPHSSASSSQAAASG